MILLSPPPRGRGTRRGNQHKNTASFSPPSAAMPYSVRSRCRMDRERIGPGERKAPWLRRNVRRNPRGEAEAACSAGSLVIPRWMSGPSQPPDRPRIRVPSDGISVWTAGRACGGSGGRLAPRDSCRTRFQSLPQRPRQGRGCKARQLPVGCGHHPATIGPRARCATQCMSLTCTTISERQSPRAALRI